MLLRKGFTLLEVLIVVIIIGILATIALPQYVSTIEKARSAEATSNIGALRNSMDRYWYDQVSQPVFANLPGNDISYLDIDNPNSDTSRLFDYAIADTSTSTAKTYTITAERIGKTATHWVKWVQTDNNTGRLYKSKALGGPEL